MLPDTDTLPTKLSFFSVIDTPSIASGSVTAHGDENTYTQLSLPMVMLGAVTYRTFVVLLSYSIEMPSAISLEISIPFIVFFESGRESK